MNDADFEDRYRSVNQDPRELRSRSANRLAALVLVGGLVAVIVLIAIFS